MSQGSTLRTATAFGVGAYALILGVLILIFGKDLWTPLAGLEPQVSWLLPDSTPMRIAALKAAGLPGNAALYAISAALSWGLIGAFAAGGFAWGVMNKGGTVLGLDKALTYVTALAVLFAISTVLEALLHSARAAFPEIAFQGGLHAVPGLWFFAMIASAAILARIASLVCHDVGALIGIAVDGEPDRLAAFAAAAEEERGAKSLEARVARRMAARSRQA